MTKQDMKAALDRRWSGIDKIKAEREHYKHERDALAACLRECIEVIEMEWGPEDVIAGHDEPADTLVKRGRALLAKLEKETK